MSSVRCHLARRTRRVFGVFLCALVVGCGGIANDDRGSFDSADVTSLPLVAASDWMPNAEPCAGRLGEALEIGVAESEPDLLVAIGPSGVLCADTFVAFESELGPDSDAMHRIWLRYMAALQELGPELAGPPGH